MVTDEPPGVYTWREITERGPDRTTQTLCESTKTVIHRYLNGHTSTSGSYDVHSSPLAGVCDHRLATRA